MLFRPCTMIPVMIGKGKTNDQNSDGIDYGASHIEIWRPAMKMKFPKGPSWEQGNLIEQAGYDRWSYLIVSDTDDILTICARIDDRNIHRIDKATGMEIMR